MACTDPPFADAPVDAFRRDGVVCVRGALQASWVARIREGLDRLRKDPSALRGRRIDPLAFLGDSYVWKLDRTFRDVAFESPIAAIAQPFLNSDSVRLFHDQLFVKPAGCSIETPWHHDIAFWPLSGRQICTVWVALSPIDRRNAPLEFVRAPDRHLHRYKAVRPDRLPYMLESDLDEPPDVDARRAEMDVVSWDLEPGDALVFDAWVLHGASSNPSGSDRIAMAWRWLGDDVHFDPRPATIRFRWHHGLSPGQSMGGPLFPQVLPHPLKSEQTALRDCARPDPVLVDANRRAYADAERRVRARASKTT